MDELKKQLIDKTGITEGQATDAVQIVSSFLKERLPAVMHTQLDKVLAGQKLEESIRQQLEDLGNEVKVRTEGLAKDLKTAFEGAFSNKKS